jgi:hypothetical protein
LSEDIVHEITCGSAGGQIARFERVAAVTVEAEALSRRQSIGVIGADDLDQPLEARERGGQFAVDRNCGTNDRAACVQHAAPGRPVAPLSAAVNFQAVPAMSRWAQR